MKYNDNGEYKDIYIKTFDTLPVGAIVEYNGATIPSGWTDLGNGKIEKTSQYIEGGAGLPSYFTTETDTGMKWIDGKPIYRKVIPYTITGTTQTNIDHNISNFGALIHCDGSMTNQYGYFMTFSSIPAFEISLTSTKLYIKSEWPTGDANIILEYTKTTD